MGYEVVFYVIACIVCFVAGVAVALYTVGFTLRNSAQDTTLQYRVRPENPEPEQPPVYPPEYVAARGFAGWSEMSDEEIRELERNWINEHLVGPSMEERLSLVEEEE